MSYKIRYMRKDDLPQISKIDKEAFPTQWPPTNYRSELQNNLARYLVVYREGILVEPEPVSENKGLIERIRLIFGKKSIMTVSKPQDLIVGFIGSWIMADELHITEIAVRESYRGQGIGHLMLIRMIEIGIKLKIQYSTLEVRLSNVTAQQLYTEFGFENVGFRKAYYSDNREDAVIMTTKIITSPEYEQKLEQLKKELARRWNIPELPSVQAAEAVRQ